MHGLKITINFHDDSGTSVGVFPLCAGDDAVNVQWMYISRDLKFCASHSDFRAKVIAKYNTHW